MAPFLIVTDLDSTLVGNDPCLNNFNSTFENCSPHGSKLVYATGRSLSLYEELESKVQVLTPEMLITSVGSEIYTTDGEIKNIDVYWDKHLLENWNLERVKEITNRYRGFLTPQPESEQRPLKISFLLNPQHQSILEPLRLELQEQNAKVIYSSNRDVDVLPKRSGKGHALNYVREVLNFPCDHTVACGDSGNDIDLFTDEKIYGIVVGNAMPELLEYCKANPRDNLYLAAGNWADGIIEGLNYFGWLNR
jgi:sucrose-6-phosphatase